MQVSDQLHAPAALSPKQEPSVSIEVQASWASEPVWKLTKTSYMKNGYVFSTTVSTAQDNLDSVDDIAIRYELHSSGIESRWGREFPCPSRRALKPIQPPVQDVIGLFTGVKRQGVGVNHRPYSSAEIANGLELYVRLHRQGRSLHIDS